MTILDANILLYAYDLESPAYPKVSAWLEALFESPESVGIPWPAIWAFLRVRTNQRLLARPSSIAETFAIVREWLEQPAVNLIQPGPRHLELLELLVTESGATGARVSDAVLAALAMERGASLASTDRDFSRFRGLRWINPLD